MSHTGPILEGKGDTDYERYIRVPELLALQKPTELLAHPEEQLFQITHQAAELWLKQLDYEVDRIAGFIAENRINFATDHLNRCTMILNLLRDQIVILETLAPVDYHQIRINSLGRGSGQESPGFNRIVTAGRRIWPQVEKLLERESLTLLHIQRTPRDHYDAYRLIEALMDYDSAFMKWRHTHMRLAMRIIGLKVNSLKGVPVAQLEAGTKEALFPQLWDVIGELTADFKPGY
jgi:tryptophan 2,3-dioxygenase